jgi:hypothetical protein
MPSSNTITPRKLYVEDLDLTTNASGATASTNVLGAPSNPVTVNKIDMVRLTQFTQAANDAAAAAAGVNLGEVYYNTTNSKLHARLT